VAKMLLAAEYELPNFYLELILPGDDVLHWEAIIAHAKQNQLPYGAVHGPFTRYADIHSGDWGLTGVIGFERLKLAAELANRLGARRFVVHDDTYALKSQSPDELDEMRQRLRPIAVDHLKTLKAICPGTTLEILTVLPWFDAGDTETINLLDTGDGRAVAQLAHDAGLEGVTYDISHGRSQGGLHTPLSVGQSIGIEYIRHLHLASYSKPYDAVPLGDGDLTPELLRNFFEACNEDKPVTVEVNEPEVELRFVHLPHLRQSLDWLREFEFLAA